jgi:hypothetical protein
MIHAAANPNFLRIPPQYFLLIVRITAITSATFSGSVHRDAVVAWKKH